MATSDKTKATTAVRDIFFDSSTDFNSMFGSQLYRLSEAPQSRFGLGGLLLTKMDGWRRAQEVLAIGFNQWNGRDFCRCTLSLKHCM